MTPKHEQRLREIESREQAASKGPWKAENIDDTSGPFFYFNDAGDKVFVPGHNINGPQAIGNYELSAFSGADAEFMAHARDDIPWLLARVRELEGERRWIPVGERLPGIGVAVLVSHIEDDGRAWSIEAYLDRNRSTWKTFDDVILVRVTHWQKMPAPVAPPIEAAKATVPVNTKRSAACGCRWNANIHGEQCPEHGLPAVPPGEATKGE